MIEISELHKYTLKERETEWARVRAITLCYVPLEILEECRERERECVSERESHPTEDVE